MRSFTNAGCLSFFHQLNQARNFVLLISLLCLSSISLAQPSTQASAINIIPVSGQNTQMTFTWTSGTGTNKVLVVLSDSTSTFTPTTLTSYNANVTTNFSGVADGSGNDIGTGTGKSVAIYNGLSSTGTVTVSGLAGATPYRIQIFEYTGNTTPSGDQLYNISTATNNPIHVKYYITTPTGKWWPNANVTAAKVQAWGGGGSGFGRSGQNGGSGGGGGGGYSEAVVTVVPGTGYTITIGSGGAAAANNGNPGTNTSFGAAIIAIGGSTGVEGASNDGGDGGPGGLASAGTATGANAVKYSGGTGGEGQPSNSNTSASGGAGGSSAGVSSNGTTESTPWDNVTAGAPPIGGGAGGDGAAGGSNGSPGSFPGGGGGGSGTDVGDNGDQSGGAGAGGLVIVSYSVPTTPSFVSANTSTTTLVKVKFNSNITSVAQANGSGFTLTGATITAAAIDGGDATVVNLTVNALAADFACSSCLSVAAGAVSNVVGGNLVISNQNVTDGVAPSVTSSTPVTTSANNGIIPRTGTITATTGANTVVGVGTSFLTELAVGAIIKNAAGTVIGTVASITDNLNLTLTANGAVAATAEAYTVGLYFTVVFNEAVTSASINASDFTATGTGSGTVGTISPSVGNSTTYIVNVTPTGSGSLKLDKTSNAYNDLAANASTATFTTGTTTTIDVTGPDATASTPVTVANTNGIIPRTGTITAGTGSPAVVGVGTSFTTELAVGAIIKNTAGGVIGTVLSITDNLNLTLTANAAVAMAADNYAVGLYYTVTFNELTQASSITSADFTLSGTGTGTIGTIAPAAGTATTFIVNVTPTGSGTLELEKNNNARLDALGNSSVTTYTAGTSANIDLTGPSVTGITPVTVSNTNGIIPRTGTITSSLASASVTGVGTAFTTELVPGATIKDATGGVVGIVLSITDNTNLTLTANASLALAAQAYTMGLYYTVTFDEATQASSITSADFALTGAGAGTIGTIFPTSSTSTTFIVNVTPTGSGALELEKNADPRLDVFGNSSITTFNTGTSANIDVTGPSVTASTPVTTALTNGVIPRTGTITTTLASPTVTGVGTAFTTEFVVGAIVKTISGTALGTVLSIADNTTMTLTANASVALTAQTYAMGLYYTVTFDEATAATSVTAADFTLSGTATGTFGSIYPSVGNSTTFIVNVNPATGGTLELEKNNDPRLDALGNSSVTTFNSGTSANIDLSGPTITGVSIPDAAMKVGSVVNVDIAVADDGGDVYTFVSGTVGGFNLTGFARSSNVLYTAQFTVTNGGVDVTAAATIPVNVVIADPANNQSVPFTTPINQAGDPIDANLPAVATVTAAGVTAPVVVNYYNSYNTGVNITIPQAAMNDPSLSGGTYAIWANNTNSNAIGTSTILVAATAIAPADINTNKVIFVDHATLSGNDEYGDPGTLYFFVILTDAATNATTGNVSTVLNVDRGVPTAPGTPNMTAGTDSGASNSDDITNDASPDFTMSGTETDATVNIYSSLDAGSRGSAVAAGASTTVSATFTTQGNGISHSITATQTDAAGNVSPSSGALAIVYDQTAPTVASGTIDLRGSSAERAYVKFSENLNFADNATTPTGFTPSAGSIGGGYSYQTTGYTDGSASVGFVFPAYPFLYMQSNSNNQWTDAVTFTYSSAAGNLLDVAGNELANNTVVNLTDNVAPVLITGMVFNPNGTGNETITFSLSETLNLADNADVVGFTVSPSNPGTAKYTLATNTITLTSAGNNAWTDAATVSYTQAVGTNVKDASASANELANIVNEPILLKSVNIFSNNAISSAYATTGNTVTLNFTASRALTALPTVVFDPTGANIAATVVDNNGGGFAANDTYTATAVMTASVTEASIAFTLTVQETTKTTVTTATTNTPTGSSVIFDKTAPNAPTAPDLSSLDDTGISNSDNTTASNTNLDFSGTAEINSTVRLYEGATLLGTTTANGAGSWTITVPSFTNGFHTLFATSRDFAGNISPNSATLQIKVDNAPVTNVIDKVEVFSPTPNTWSTTNGVDDIGGQPLTFKVTFAERINTSLLQNNQFQDYYGTGSVIAGGGKNISLDGTYPDSIVYVTFNNVSGLGQFSLYFEDITTQVQDLAGNLSTGSVTFFPPFTNNYYYSLVRRQPTNPVAGFSVTDISQEYGARLSITPGLPGTTAATHFLVMARESQGATPFPAVQDGVNYADDVSDGDYGNSGVSDGLFILNTTNPGAVTSIEFYAMKSGMTFDFRIYPYTSSTSGEYSFTDNINYGAPTNISNYLLPAKNNSTVVSTPVNADIQSTVDVSAAPGQNVFTFTVTDGVGTAFGWGYEFAPTRFNGLTINKLAHPNGVANWPSAIANAELYDVNNPTNFVVASSITASQIQFTSIPSDVSGDLGYLDPTDHWWTGITSSKTYGLRIYLQGGAGALNGLDNQVLAFTITNASFNIDTPAGTPADHWASTTFTLGQTANSGINTIRINASQFVITNNLPATIGVNHTFLASQPSIEARDINNNIDTDFSAYNLTINTPGIGYTGTDNFVGGVLTLNNFRFTDPGTTTITFANAGNTFNVTTSAVNAVISSTTRVDQVAVTTPISSVATFAPGTIPTVGQQNGVVNFSFTVTDDFGVGAAVDDVLPTRISSIVIRRDGANGTATGGATFDNWTNSIAGARLRVGAADVSATVVINSDNITFTNIPNVSNTATNPGYIADGTSRTFTLTIWLQNPVAAGLRDILDGEDFVFSLTDDTDFSLTSASGNYSSTLNTTFTGFTSGDGNNAVTVVASQLDYITAAWDPGQSPTGPTQSYDADVAPVAQLKARDANQNLDRGFSGSPTYDASVTFFDSNLIDAVTFPATNAGGMTFTTGQLTLNSNLRVSSSGNGPSGATTNIEVTSNGLTGTSSPFTINYSQESNIIKDPSFDTEYTTNIQTINFREATTLTNVNSVELERFLLQDGGDDTSDADGSATKLNSIRLNVENYENIRLIGLFDGNTLLEQLDSTAFAILGGGDIEFIVSPTFDAADNNDRDLTVRASFKADVDDNEQIRVRVVSATVAGVSSQLASSSTAFAALTTYQNRTEVVATKVVFDNLPATASISVPVVAAGVIVSARDAYGNVDEDYNGTISATSNTNTGSFNTINNPATTSPAGDFVGGYFTYPTSFQFDIGNGNVQLTINSGAGSGGNNVNAVAIAGTSAVINVISSFESTLRSIWGPGFTQDISYINYQLASMTNSGEGHWIDYLRLVDGGDFDWTDADGANTVLNDLTLGISNPQSVRTVAIFAYDPEDGTVNKIDETSTLTPTGNGYSTVSFTGLGITAEDNLNPAKYGYIDIIVLATFKDTPAEITDNDLIQVAVLSAAVGTGSKFAPDAAQTGTIGGVQTSDYSPFTFPEASASVTVGSVGPLNRLTVIATSLDFVQQPSPYAGKEEPIVTGDPQASPNGVTGIVHARDRYGVIDVDFDDVAGVSAGAVPISYPNIFINGVLDLTGMQYQNAGDGTLTVTATDSEYFNSLNSNAGIDDVAGNSIPCGPVDVVHVTAADDQTNGVLVDPSLKGGTADRRIFGVDFYAEHSNTTDNEPKLSSFSIVFKDDNNDPYPYTSGTGTIFKNFKLAMAEGTGAPVTLAEGVDYTLDPLDVQSQNLIDLGAPTTSKDKLTFTLTNPVDLSFSNYKFYLNVDVDVNVSVGTPPITPHVIDLGYGNNLPKFQNTNQHIMTSIGSSSAAVVGITRKFASTKPPILTYTDPFNGRLNVDTTKTTIKMKFDVPVVTFDGIIKVYNRETGTLRQVFVATNGTYVSGQPLNTQVVDTLFFQPQNPAFRFRRDTVYYVTVEKGVFSNTDLTQRKGISDEGFNLFGGIQYSGTFYFKGSSPNAPVMLGTDATKYFYTPTSVTFNFKFNQAGKVHYMIVAPYLGTPATPVTPPSLVTNDQILGNTPYITTTVMARGTTTIDQLAPNNLFATVNVDLINGQDYFVYAFAENDAQPVTVATAAPYGGFVADSPTQNPANDYVVGAAGPTFRLRKTAANTVLVANPRMEVCANSSVKMEEPIIISEVGGNPADFAAGVPVGATQTFNLLLPTGFQFDVAKAPSIAFNGTDFGTLPLGTNPYRFRSSTLLEVNFVNSGSGSFDNIVIQNLYIIASSVDIGGNIIRFSGNGLTTIPEDRVLARISSSAATTIPFTNSYQEAFQPWPYPQITKTVTYIPDNFSDVVRLKPVPPAGDYGSSFFSGSGLTNDQLSLNAVELDASFNITLTHTDQNGCISNTVEQYLVYDHTNVIPELLKTTPSYQISGTKVGLIPGTPDPITNVPGTPAPTLNVADSVSYVGLAGYQLIDLYANIPRSASAGQVLAYEPDGPDADNQSENVRWESLVRNIPRLATTDVNGNGGLHPDPLLGQVFKTYNWEYSQLINSTATAGAGVQYPYEPVATNRFYRTVNSTGTGNGRNYFEAGSLGIIEFTGVYQSTADFSVFVPFRQEVEVFIPAIPLVEAVGNTAIVGDTVIFCENGAPFIITGYPLATAGVSKGFFKLRDAADTTIVIVDNGGFVDNGNGTATFNPTRSILKNSYKTILVEYTYQQDISPAIGKGYMYIKVTPKPKPNFVFVSKFAEITDPNNGNALDLGTIQTGRPIDTLSYCVNNTIKFKNTSTFPAIAGNGYFSNFNQTWDMGQPQAVRQNQDSVYYTYTGFGKYDVTFSSQSQYGCASGDTTISVYVGVIPTPDITMTGISTATPLKVRRASLGISSGLAYPKSDTLRSEWYFGEPFLTNQSDTAVYTPTNKHLYTQAGHYKVTLLQRTSITETNVVGSPVNPGCEITYQRDVIIVPQAVPVSPAPGSPFVATFDANVEAWQVDDGLTDNALPSNVQNLNQASSWRMGDPSSAGYPALTPNLYGATGWYTDNGSGTYLASEKSYLYTSAYDFNSMSRPMLSFDQYTQTMQNDGIAFDFSIDNLNVADPNKVWYRLGKQGEGSDWYNRSGLASKPGAQTEYPSTQASLDYGWSESLGGWVNSRISITPAIPTATPIIFRFALSVSNDPVTVAGKGMAIDNFRFGERTRVVVVENFTSTSNTATAEKDEADFLRGDFSNTVTEGVDYVKLNYHVGFPAQDPFNLTNTADPSARALYYGVNTTPNARLDGFNFATTQDPYFSEYGKAKYDTRTLDLAGVDITFDEAYQENGAFKVKVSVRGNESIPIGTYLHVVLAEQGLINATANGLGTLASGETDFEYVVRKMLPTASGRRFTKALIPAPIDSDPANDTIQFSTVTWIPDQLYGPADDMVAIAFVQDEATQKIHQAKMVAIPDPDIVTGIENPFTLKDIKIYPNPADNQLNIVFPNALEVDVPLMMFDPVGRVTHNHVVKKGEESVTLETGGNSAGVYILQMNLGEGRLVRTKIIINHQE